MLLVEIKYVPKCASHFIFVQKLLQLTKLKFVPRLQVWYHSGWLSDSHNNINFIVNNGTSILLYLRSRKHFSIQL